MTTGVDAAELLVLEPAEQGHGEEWLRHLVAHARRRHPVPRLVFVVAPRVADRLRGNSDVMSPGGPTVIALSARATALCNHRNLTVSSLARWWAMRRYLRQTGTREGLFLELDHLSLALALGLPLGAGRSVSGVLFRPSVHYQSDRRANLGEWLRDVRKDLLYRLMLCRPAVRRVHTLDDAFPAFAETRYRQGAKVSALPDPVFPVVHPTADDRALAARAPDGRVLLVLFGVLSERKGVLAVLRSLAVLEASTAGRLAVILAGEVDPPIRAEVEGAIAALHADQPSLWLHLEPRYLSAGEIAGLVERSDVVLAPYQRFVGSSGVLMWAAGRGRPVIAQDYGLVGRLVREHGLGLAVDTMDPSELAHALTIVGEGGGSDLAKPERLRAFAEGRTADAFAAGILDPLRREAPTDSGVRAIARSVEMAESGAFRGR